MKKVWSKSWVSFLKFGVTCSKVHAAQTCQNQLKAFAIMGGFRLGVVKPVETFLFRPLKSHQLMGLVGLLFGEGLFEITFGMLRFWTIEVFNGPIIIQGITDLPYV